LLKAGEQNRSRRRRYFVLLSDRIMYYKNKEKAATAATAQGSISLHSDTALARGKMAFTFGITPSPGSNSSRTFILTASDIADRDSWMTTIQRLLPSLTRAPRDRRLMQNETFPSDEKASRVDPRSVKEGYLDKLDPEHKHKRRRYFILLRDRILYFKTKKDAADAGESARGVILLSKDTVVASGSGQVHAVADRSATTETPLANLSHGDSDRNQAFDKSKSMVNFVKVYKLYEMIEDLRRSQVLPYAVKPDPVIQSFLAAQASRILSEKDCLARSKRIEPPSSKDHRKVPVSAP